MIAYICDTHTGETLFKGDISNKPRLIAAGHSVVTETRPTELHVWDGDNWVESKEMQNEQALRGFREARRSAYPCIGDQLDLIYKCLVDAPPGIQKIFRPWLRTIRMVKRSIPKPEELL